MQAFHVYLLYKKLKQQVRRAIVGKKKLHFEHYNYSVQHLPKVVPKTIWIFWDKPLETAPEFVRYSVRTWQERNPDWTVQLLTPDNLAQFVDVPEPKDARKVQARSDVIRLALLAKYGGVWVDATCCCVRPLNDWLLPAMNSGFFAFPDTYPGRIISSWFLAAEKGNYLIGKWDRQSRQYFSRGGRLGDYFWVMHLFEYIVRTDRKAREIWEATPKFSVKGPSLLKRIIAEPKYAELLPEGVDETSIPVLKISSSNKHDIAIFSEAMDKGEDVPLRAMAELMVRAKGEK